MIDKRFLNAYSDLLVLVGRLRKPENKEKVAKAWDHCVKAGHINGFSAPEKVRRQIMVVTRAINMYHPDKDSRRELKKDVSNGLHSQATYKKRKRRRS